MRWANTAAHFEVQNEGSSGGHVQEAACKVYQAPVLQRDIDKDVAAESSEAILASKRDDWVGVHGDRGGSVAVKRD